MQRASARQVGGISLLPAPFPPLEHGYIIEEKHVNQVLKFQMLLMGKSCARQLTHLQNTFKH